MDKFYFLNGYKQNVNLRLRREKISKSVWKLIKSKLTVLQNIPFIELVTITGSLSVLNSEINSDIDFFIITKPNRVWITRLFLYFVEKYIEGSSPSNVHLCFNFINSTSKIKQSPENIYVAREIIQMKLLLGESVYRDFFRKNYWLSNYLPNIDLEKYTNRVRKIKREKQHKSIISRMSARLNNTNSGLLDFIIRKLDYLEYRRATRKIFKNYKQSAETNFSKDEYKAHFSNNQQRIIRDLNY